MAMTPSIFKGWGKRISLAGVLVVGFVGPGMSQGDPRIWNFDQDKAGGLPSGFEVLSGHWTVTPDPAAPSPPHIVAQVATKETWPGVVVKDGEFKNAVIEVKFKTVSGKDEQAAGIIFRCKDSKNFYVLRADAIEDNVALLKFSKGMQAQLKKKRVQIKSGMWYSLRVTAVGPLIRAYLNGKPLFSVSNKSYPKGKVGLWTKADSVVYFDDFSVKPL